MYHKQLIGLLIKAWVKRIYNKKPISLRKGIGFWYAGHGIYLDSESLLWGL